MSTFCYGSPALDVLPKFLWTLTIKALTYEDRLKHFKMTSLSTRRLRFDLLTVFKLFNGLIDVPFDHLFFNPSVTRGHPCKLKVNFSHSSYRSSFFSQRVVHWWNKLPSDCVGASSVSCFKIQVDAFLREQDFW